MRKMDVSTYGSQKENRESNFAPRYNQARIPASRPCSICLFLFLSDSVTRWHSSFHSQECCRLVDSSCGRMITLISSSGYVRRPLPPTPPHECLSVQGTRHFGLIRPPLEQCQPGDQRFTQRYCS